ncbi:MAG: RnfABCDGE type electron transport complex subunit G [Paludibacteraceae bacterium]|nr:RnfABCDGE type electron transport complex subunit G [Paludibacteraceae bacterium]
MEKLKSSLQNMVLSLVIICIVAAGALAGVYTLTQANIAAQEKAKQQAAIQAVLPEGCTIAEPEIVDGLTLYKAYKDTVWVATAIETSEVGFDGPQVIMVGIDTKGIVLNYEILKQTETPGLGAHIEHWFKHADKPGQNIIGRKAGKLAVSKDGGEIDAITAATISSRAFLKAINKAYKAVAQEEEVDAATSASQQQHSEETEVSHE